MGKDDEEVAAMFSRLSPELASRIHGFCDLSSDDDDSTLDCQSFSHYVSDASAAEPYRWAPQWRRPFCRRVLYSDCPEEDRVPIDRVESAVRSFLRVGEPCIFYDDRRAPLHCALVVGVEPLAFLSRYGEQRGLVLDDLSQLTGHYPAASVGRVRFRWLWGPDYFVRSKSRLYPRAFRAMLSLLLLALLPWFLGRNLEEFLVFS